MPRKKGSRNKNRDYCPATSARYLAGRWHSKGYDLSDRKVLQELLTWVLRKAYLAGAKEGVLGYLRKQHREYWNRGFFTTPGRVTRESGREQAGGEEE